MQNWIKHHKNKSKSACAMPVDRFGQGVCVAKSPFEATKGLGFSTPHQEIQSDRALYLKDSWALFSNKEVIPHQSGERSRQKYTFCCYTAFGQIVKGMNKIKIVMEFSVILDCLTI